MTSSEGVSHLSAKDFAELRYLFGIEDMSPGSRPAASPIGVDIAEAHALKNVDLENPIAPWIDDTLFADLKDAMFGYDYSEALRQLRGQGFHPLPFNHSISVPSAISDSAPFKIAALFCKEKDDHTLFVYFAHLDDEPRSNGVFTGVMASATASNNNDNGVMCYFPEIEPRRFLKLIQSKSVEDAFEDAGKPSLLDRAALTWVKHRVARALTA